MELQQILYNFIISNRIEILLVLIILWMTIRIYNKRKRKLKKFRRRKDIKKNFYNTGFRIIFTAFDILKFKLRLGDYCDKTGIRYNYLIAFKFFKWEYIRLKTQNQDGIIKKRKITFRS